MNIMTRCGSIDNVLIYEHYCDTKEDMANIDPKYINLGSICIVVKGTNDELEIYMADSNKQWSSLGIGNGGGGSSSEIMLSDIADTDISSSLTNGDVLTYDSTTEKWKNAAGGSGGGLVVHVNNEGVFDKTWQEVTDALAEGLFVTIVAPSYGSENGASQSHIIMTSTDNGAYYVSFPNYLEMSPATTDSASGYPILVYD